MKVIFLLILNLTFLFSQTYKVDMGGVPNQYPTQIEVVDGDVIIATTENFGKGYGIDAVSLINVTKNKVFRVANSSRQANPRILIDSNKILFTHWEITGSGYDAGQIIFLNSIFDVIKKQQLDFGSDTEVYSSLNIFNNNYISGDITSKAFVSKLDNNVNVKSSKIYKKNTSQNGCVTYLYNFNNQLLSTYFDRDYMGLMIIDTNLNYIISKDYEFLGEVKFSFNITNIDNNIYVYSDNYNRDFSSLLGTSLHKFDNNLNYQGEYYIRINNSRAQIKQIKNINNYLYVVGSYLENNILKGFVCQLDSNLNIVNNYHCKDFSKVMSITSNNNEIFLCGLSNLTNDYNGDIYYAKTNRIENICNSINIKSVTTIEKVNGLPKLLNNNFSVSNISNIGYQDPSYSYTTTKTNEICNLSTPTPIQDIINKYIDVLEIDTCNNKIKVAPTNEYTIEDYVLMIQMQGALIDTTNTPKYGDLIDLGSCGLYEFGYIAKIDKVTDGSWITFKNKIVNNYDVKGSVQLVGVPIYGNANVVGDIIGKPWDGKSGGVIVVKTTDTLNLVSGNIDASGIGFRGGKHSTLSEDKGIQSYFTSNSRYAGEKGEGIYKVTNINYRYGRGKTANGGGGGNAHNGGGGGGSNMYFESNNSLYKIGGLGGYALGGWSALGGYGGELKIKDNVKFNRLIFGGGGGGGHTNETNNGDGGNGGGIIITDCPIIINTNNSIISNGITAGNAFVDGGGGGGAGGTICLKNNKIINKILLKTDGGNGGDSQKGSHLGGASGGGGTSGRIFLVDKVKTNEIDLSLQKGVKGYTDNGGVTGFYPGYDAEDNDNKVLNIDFLIQQTQTIDSIESIGNYQKSFSLCDSNKVTLTAPTTNPKYTYKWDTGETGTSIQVSKAGKYKCTILYGCKNYIAEFEVIDNQIQYNLTQINFENKCGLDSVQVAVSFNSTNTSIVWFDGSNAKTRTFTKNGKYKYTLKLSGFCDLVSEVDIKGISSGNSTNLLSFTPDTLIFSNNDIDKLTCQTFTLTNVGIDTVTLSELTYLKKLNFSSPNSIFPITLFPKESKNLEVCFYGNKFKTNYSDSIRFDNCYNPKFLTLLADIPEDTLSFTTRCMLKFNAAAPSKSIALNKTQLNELIQELQTNYKLTILLGLELYDVNAILPNQLVYLESYSIRIRILIVE